MDGASKPVYRTFAGRLRADAFDLHNATLMGQSGRAFKLVHYLPKLMDRRSPLNSALRFGNLGVREKFLKRL
jgi:hypothetical protein